MTDEAVTFSLHRETAYGEVCVVVGPHETLGNWDPHKGLKMQWTPGHVWRAATRVPASACQPLSYKYFIVRDDGLGVPRCEPTPRREKRLGTAERVDEWGEGPVLQELQFPGWPFQGRLFRSPLPLAPMFDSRRTALAEWKAAGVDVVVSMTSPEEMRAKTGTDITRLMWAQGFGVINYPVEDFHAPTDLASYGRLVDTVARFLSRGCNVVVHCHAGVGRTGTLVSCVLLRHLGLPAPEVLSLVRSQIPGAVETQTQVDFVTKTFVK